MDENDVKRLAAAAISILRVYIHNMYGNVKQYSPIILLLHRAYDKGDGAAIAVLRLTASNRHRTPVHRFALLRGIDASVHRLRPPSS